MVDAKSTGDCANNGSQRKIRRIILYKDDAVGMGQGCQNELVSGCAMRLAREAASVVLATTTKSSHRHQFGSIQYVTVVVPGR